MMARQSASAASVEARVAAFRDLVYEGIRRADGLGKTIKPYDGSISLSWPAMVHTSAANRKYTLRLSCSVLGGESSHYSWSGRSWRAVFEHATADVQAWIAEMDKDSK